jgi:hypothetical protein
MPLAVSVDPRNIDASGDNLVIAVALITPSGAYPTGGDTMDLTPVMQQVPGTEIVQVSVPDTNSPNNTAFGQIGGYYVPQGQPGPQGGNQNGNPVTAYNAWKLKAFSAGGAELGAGAYPASVLADVITVEIKVRKMI